MYKKIYVFSAFLALLVSVAFNLCLVLKNNDSLNMNNTVSPIMLKLVADKCGYSDPNKLGGMIISKREPIESCAGGIGNAYYTMCTIPTKKTISLNSYSCIPESEVTLPNNDLYSEVFKSRKEN